VSLTLEGKTAVVTGAGGGLGQAFSVALAEKGARLVLAGRSVGTLEETAQLITDLGGSAITVATDVTRTAQVDALIAAAVAEYGSVDVLVNNSGILEPAPIVELTDDAWDRVIETNLRGTFAGIRAAGRQMIIQGSGSIINIASNWASMGIKGFSSYSASKAAIIALTRTASIELVRYGITVNALAPGYFETDMNQSARDDDKMRNYILSTIPMRRMGKPEELSELLVLLAGPGGRFITGETIVVDGGQLAQ
jgi:NAD(P)-dependent dehydrogenase (short-subunit alcohol dehydrogenase family)